MKARGFRFAYPVTMIRACVSAPILRLATSPWYENLIGAWWNGEYLAIPVPGQPGGHGGPADVNIGQVC
jgi:hypothetical protein